jgi:hypothetical protein
MYQVSSSNSRLIKGQAMMIKNDVILHNMHIKE